MINVALPKGRMGIAAYALMEKAGFACADVLDAGRKLVFEDAHKGICYFLVKPSDTAVYVEHGVADIGIVGRDIMLETQPDVYELTPLGFGNCKLAVAAQHGFKDDRSFPLRVATTYPNCARAHFSQANRAIEIIKLHGSVELAPLLGLSDVIVDIVETGSTLRENGLEIIEHIADSEALLIANKSSFMFKSAEINSVVKEMKKHNDKNI